MDVKFGASPSSPTSKGLAREKETKKSIPKEGATSAVAPQKSITVSAGSKRMISSLLNKQSSSPSYNTFPQSSHSVPSSTTTAVSSLSPFASSPSPASSLSPAAPLSKATLPAVGDQVSLFLTNGTLIKGCFLRGSFTTEVVLQRARKFEAGQITSPTMIPEFTVKGSDISQIQELLSLTTLSASESDKDDSKNALTSAIKEDKKSWSSAATSKADLPKLNSSRAALSLPAKNATSKSSERADCVSDSPLSKEIKERELKPWAADAAIVEALGLDVQNHSRGAWNQFEVNEKLFGCTTTFDEDLYTTRLNKENPNFKLLEKEAERLAREISSTPSANIHLAEERGHEINHVDEEDRFGAVIRKLNAYIPPALRKGSAMGMLKANIKEKEKDYVTDVKKMSLDVSNPSAALPTSSENEATFPSPVNIEKLAPLTKVEVDSQSDAGKSVDAKPTPSTAKSSKLNVNAVEFRPASISYGLNPTMPHVPYMAAPMMTPMPYGVPPASYVYPSYQPMPPNPNLRYRYPPPAPLFIPPSMIPTLPSPCPPTSPIATSIPPSLTQAGNSYVSFVPPYHSLNAPSSNSAVGAFASTSATNTVGYA